MSAKERVVEAKLDIYIGLCEKKCDDGLSADRRWAAYNEALGMYIMRQLSKSELELVVLKALGAENIRRHNALLLALLADASARALTCRRGTRESTWMKMLPSERREDEDRNDEDSSQDDDDDILALHREWHRAGLAQTAPISQSVQRRTPPQGPPVRLDGSSLLALKMNDISKSAGLEGVSDSAVQLMSIALHAYARNAARRCHADFASRQAPLPLPLQPASTTSPNPSNSASDLTPPLIPPAISGAAVATHSPIVSVIRSSSTGGSGGTPAAAS